MAVSTGLPTFSENIFGGTPRTLSDIHECMPFVAQPRSQAAGCDTNAPAFWGTPNVFNLSQVPYNFTGQLSDHSGQFTRTCDQDWQLYKTFEGIISP